MKTILLVLCLIGLAQGQGKIVVNNDEWTLSDSGFSAPNDPGRFIQNVCAWFTGGAPGRFLAYSPNFSYNQSSLRQAIEDAGHIYIVDYIEPFTLEYLQTFDGVFIGGYPADNAILIQYVQAGGNVYICGGTGDVREVLVYNDFLQAFGLAFIEPYNGIIGNMPINSPHLIFQDVHSLYQNNGSTVIDLDLIDARGRILVRHTESGAGLYAVFDPGCGSVDVNGDGCIDDVDLSIVLEAFGNVCGACDADINCDGVVDDIDLSTILELFGTGC